MPPLPKQFGLCLKVTARSHVPVCPAGLSCLLPASCASSESLSDLPVHSSVFLNSVPSRETPFLPLLCQSFSLGSVLLPSILRPPRQHYKLGEPQMWGSLARSRRKGAKVPVSETLPTLSPSEFLINDTKELLFVLLGMIMLLCVGGVV